MGRSGSASSLHAVPPPHGVATEEEAEEQDAGPVLGVVVHSPRLARLLVEAATRGEEREEEEEEDSRPVPIVEVVASAHPEPSLHASLSCSARLETSARLCHPRQKCPEFSARRGRKGGRRTPGRVLQALPRCRPRVYPHPVAAPRQPPFPPPRPY